MLLLAPNVLSYFRGLVAATTLILSLAGPTPPDLYIMAMSHQPEFCYQHKSEGWEGCQHPRDYWKTHLTIHGLWPEVREQVHITPNDLLAVYMILIVVCYVCDPCACAILVF